ncbi:MAG: hypothetical protein ACREP0_00890 [Rhodanobacteraceae bacterium]
MDKIARLVQQLRETPHNVRFVDLAGICDHYFGAPRQRGTSRRVYRTPWPGDPRVNIQRGAGGMAKTYQVKHVLAAIRKLEEQR